MCIGKRIKERRKELKLTQVQLSEMVGIAQQSLQKIENGTTKNPRNIQALADALDCAPEFLQFGIGENENSSKKCLATLKTN